MSEETWEQRRARVESDAKRLGEGIRWMLTPYDAETRKLALFEAGFCMECGSYDPEHGCQCWNDE